MDWLELPILVSMWLYYSVLDESRMCFHFKVLARIKLIIRLKWMVLHRMNLFYLFLLRWFAFYFQFFFVLSKICSSFLDHHFHFIDVFNCAIEYILYSVILSAITWQYWSMWQLLVIGRNFSFLSFYSVRLYLLVSGTQKIDSSFTIFTYSVKYSVLF